MRSRRQCVVAAALAVATGAMPAVAHANTSASTARITLSAARTATVTLAFPNRVRVTPTLVRPDCAKASYVASFVGVEFTRPRSAFTYFGLLWCDGSTLSGQLTGNEWSAGGTGYASTGGGLPRRLQTAPVWLSAGRYQVTVLSHGPTTVDLSVDGEPTGSRTVIASHKIAVGENWAAYAGGAAASAAYRRLSVHVPVGSHAVLLLEEQKWQGAGDTVYSYDACLGPAQTPCATVPVPSAYPDVRVGDGAAEGAVIVVNPPAGAKTANYYTAQSGITTHQELLALALP